jgi:ABC-2 type transport system ATP-binding protein
MPTYAIECAGLTKRFRKRSAVDNLDLTVEPGEVFGFLGPNGAGKTTTIRMILGLSRPTGGSLRVLGQPVPSTLATMARVGSLVESPAFYPWMSGVRNLQTLVPQRLPKKELIGLLDRVGLREAADAHVRTYSQGMKQRLGLALALVGNPRLLVLDEPANGLDPAGVRDFRSIIIDAASGGASVFLSSHQLTEVERACDRVALLNHGRLISRGAVKELGGDERSVVVTLSPSDRDRAIAALVHLPVEVVDESTLRIKGGTGKAVNERLARVGVYPDSLRVEQASLEERFLALTDASEGVGGASSN